MRRLEGPAVNGLLFPTGSRARIAARKAELEAAAPGGRSPARRRARPLLPAPPRRLPPGSVHPTMQVMDEMIAVFAEMGFSVAEGSDIEPDDFHNFSALNFPPPPPGVGNARHLLPEARPRRRAPAAAHPYQPDPGAGDAGGPTWPSARRSSPSTRSPPIRIIGPGRVYRCDSDDHPHTPMFHQMEGLVIDPRAIHMGHLKWTLDAFVPRRFFEMDGVTTAPAFRPHHFPFTEPSAEMDVQGATARATA